MCALGNKCYKIVKPVYDTKTYNLCQLYKPLYIPAGFPYKACTRNVPLLFSIQGEAPAAGSI